jgi:thymidylate synthase ThyX
MTNNRKLSRYVSNPNGNVFVLKNLPEEVVAVLFAYYSRSTDGLRENLLRLLADGDLEVAAGDEGGFDVNAADLGDAQEKARSFHEKWVVGYGHSSVAEHAVVKLAIENVSILASKIVEDCRLASYTEKSTRYVAFDPTKAIYPENVMASPEAQTYARAIKRLMDAYVEWMEPVTEAVKSRVPRGEKQSPRAYEAACRSTACDTLRYLLPTASHTNIGITINARSLESMIAKLLSHPLAEARQLGDDIKNEAVKVVPTLLKYADRNEYRASRNEAVTDAPATALLGVAPGQNGVRLLAPHLSEREALELIAMPYPSDAAGSLAEILDGRGKFDPAPRVFERVALTFEIVLDYGAFRDVQRHRMAAICVDPLGVSLGYEKPRDLAAFGLTHQFDELMQESAQAYERLAANGFLYEAPYVLPLAYRVRTIFTASLRELFHFIELRSARQGHPSYRKIAQQMHAEIERVYPHVAPYIRVNRAEYALTRD